MSFWFLLHKAGSHVLNDRSFEERNPAHGFSAFNSLERKERLSEQNEKGRKDKERHEGL